MQTKVTADPQLQNDGATLKHRESQNKQNTKISTKLQALRQKTQQQSQKTQQKRILIKLMKSDY